MNPYAAMDQTTVVSLQVEQMPPRRLGDEPAEERREERQRPTDERCLDDVPGRILYIHKPTSSAIGIVQAIVKVPHELPGTRRTASAGNT
jgi:hypothetical protein